MCVDDFMGVTTVLAYGGDVHTVMSAGRVLLHQLLGPCQTTTAITARLQVATDSAQPATQNCVLVGS